MVVSVAWEGGGRQGKGHLPQETGIENYFGIPTKLRGYFHCICRNYLYN